MHLTQQERSNLSSNHPIYPALRIIALMILIITVEWFNAKNFSSDEHIKIIEMFIAFLSIEGGSKLLKSLMNPKD